MIIIEIVFVMRNTVSQLSVGNFHSFVRKVLESAISLETVNILLSTFSCQHQEMRQSARYYLKLIIFLYIHLENLQNLMPIQKSKE